MNLPRSLFLAGLLVGAPLYAEPPAPESLIVADFGQPGNFEFLNPVVGWDLFFFSGFLGEGRVIGNVEAGLIWDGHEVFNRPLGSSPAITQTFVGAGALNEVDFHATMVGHVLAGTGYVEGSDPAQFTFAGLGMAPLASLWSGAIATSYSPTDIGAFSVTSDSVISVYETFFQGIGGVKPDVINSSWGGADAAASLPEMVAIDGLARENPTVAFVASAGNGGNAVVSAPASTFNSIAVGSLGGPHYLTPSSFSSSGLADFFNPATNTTFTGVRVAVDLAAPGEGMALAAYLGQSGGLGAASDPGIQDQLNNPSPTDLYFLESAGTSFAAPIVAGGIALLRDVAANSNFDLNANPNGIDARVIKSVLMASATASEGWDNGQTLTLGGVISTTQALDAKTGAGAVNLAEAVAVHVLSGTRDVTGNLGGFISTSGWDFAELAPTGVNNYTFADAFTSQIELTVSLNWFAERVYDAVDAVGEDLSFADFNLEIWQVVGGSFLNLVAESKSIYNNSEFLRVQLGEGNYGLRITFESLLYDLDLEAPTPESYGLAWRAEPVPEPGSVVLIFVGGALFFGKRGRRIRRSR